jgi:RTX calcium-binding nonapeptide repeat (4 copies)
VTRPAVRVAALVLAVLVVAGGSAWAATIKGTARADTLRGTARADTIDGKRGNDRLFGAGGNDVLVGGPGSDLLVGGAGADRLRCGPGRDTATRDVLDTVSADCEVVRGPTPAPPPPQPPSPPPAPGAPATYVFGPEVFSTQQAAVRDALDVGARYYRAALGRELPPFTVWGHTDAEAMARVFAETSGEVRTLEDSRALWANLVAHAGTRGLWVGPQWFAERAGSNATKILAKEEFILLLYSIAGSTALNSGEDQVPRAGPRWLSEGTAESIAYRAIASVGMANLAAVRADWAQRTRSTSVTLERLAVRRGQLEAGSNAWGVMPLAVERLVGADETERLLAYFAAIGRGEPWPAAFATAFGKTVEAFYTEFAEYRRGL